MNINLNHNEIKELLKKGTSLERSFIFDVIMYDVNFKDLLDKLETYFIEYDPFITDLRNLINCGLISVINTNYDDMDLSRYYKIELKKDIYLLIE